MTFQEVDCSPGLIFRRILVFLFIPVILIVFLFFTFGKHSELPKELLLSKKYNSMSSRLNILDSHLDSLENTLFENYYKNDNSFRVILELDSLPLSIRKAGTGGAEKKFYARRFGDSEQLVKLAQKIDKLERQLEIQKNSYNFISEQVRLWIDELQSVPSIMPVSVNDLIMVSSAFGVRVDPFTQQLSDHHGYDYVASNGTKVYATGNGIVTLSNFSRKGYGNEVIIDHDFGFSTRYAHLSEILVEQGDSVRRGQVIGLVGTTGRSTGPHLHYEVRYMNQPVNPYFYYADDLSGEEYEIMVRNNNSEKMIVH